MLSLFTKNLLDPVGDGLTKRDLGFSERDVNVVFVAHALCVDFQMEFAHPRNNDLQRMARMTVCAFTVRKKTLFCN